VNCAISDLTASRSPFATSEVLVRTSFENIIGLYIHIRFNGCFLVGHFTPPVHQANRHGYFYAPDVLPVTQLTLSEAVFSSREL